MDILWSESLDCAPGIRTSLVEHRRLHRAAATRWVRRGIAAGGIPRDVNAEQLAVEFCAFMVGTVYQWGRGDRLRDAGGSTIQEATMGAVRRTRLNEFIWRNHVRLYKATGGRVGGSIGGNPVLLLTTTGRKTGQPRTVALAHLAESEAWVVIASFAGQPRHPGWWLNLLENPVGSVQKGTTVVDVRAREAEGEERERLWAAICKQEQGFADYQTWTERRIPVVVLEPLRRPG